MTLNELASILKDMYTNARPKEKVTMIHLFAVKYAEQIKKIGVRQIVEQSGIPSTFKTELNKGVRLAKYVNIKQPSSI
jgi:hypothetical protein